MKQDIHPQYYAKATITCACGNTIKVGSTQQKTEVEVCSDCHPFYTGKQKLVDVAGRVDKFKKRLADAGKAREGVPTTDIKQNRTKDKKDDTVKLG